ncbi:aminotransferase class V-fold PLP-dependent enzyme [Dyadobacter chenwenxiniae]|uniref:phosphoserine transaminase n=1 Tax=Dyadobacter chenwenxiniae TaxID=2906456 RepID=A0A9X1PGQ3_9BACT|nr:aminotransferase class V-fold PLP-dependent enzyme [Dyadobacter chenwenxiniae]MCF0060780.1 aminotransferase class V-fold PLP-dependent enzyme [Dyadobacter chenwenxiniae]UON80613.1 aminotransferase class V-fold PLP-dependent enzyme [Dyadobacter chenwenxiniae]
MITFYPGPSKVYDEVGQYLQEAFDSGVISANHRSTAFMQMLEGAIGNLKTKLNVPDDYEVYFVSSATECWEIIAESLISDGSLHIYNGAFGEKWMEYTQKLTGAARSFPFETNEDPKPNAGIMPSANEVICITHNETSNGTALTSEFLNTLRAQSDNIIAVDATSSMAGVILPWESADIWYGSVQKCFGLPAGMGVMIVSPKAVELAIAIGNRSHYNSLLFIRDNFLKFQTPYTPNTLGIYLMGRVMQQVAPIKTVARQTLERAQDWYSFLPENGYQLLVEYEAVRSETVMAVKDTKERIEAIKKAGLQEGIVLGNGYGEDKETSFRIANFPAISDIEIQTLKDFLVFFSSK